DFVHRRLDTDALRRHFHWIDVVVELDPNCWLLERMIERADPFHLERFGFSQWDYLQIRKRAAAFRIEQAIHDEVKRASEGKWLSRADPESCRFGRAGKFLLARLDCFDGGTRGRIAVLKVNVLSRRAGANF